MVSVVARAGLEAQLAQVGPVNTPLNGPRGVCRLARAMILDDEGELSRPVCRSAFICIPEFFTDLTSLLITSSTSTL